jgi:urease accessory protein
MLIERIPPPPDLSALAGKSRDYLALTSEERRWARRRFQTAAGREIALALPTGAVLRPGIVLAVENDWYLEVEAAPEPVIAIKVSGVEDAVRIAFEIGNRHFPLAINHDEILVPDDSAMEQLLSRLGVGWTRRRAVFTPIAERPAGHSHDS